MELEIVFGFILLVVASVLVAFAYVFLEKRNLKSALELVRLAVRAAEQMYNDDQIDGDARFRFVVDFLKKRVKLDEDTLKILIESEVHEVNREARRE